MLANTGVLVHDRVLLDSTAGSTLVDPRSFCDLFVVALTATRRVQTGFDSCATGSASAEFYSLDLQEMRLCRTATIQFEWPNARFYFRESIDPDLPAFRKPDPELHYTSGVSFEKQRTDRASGTRTRLNRATTSQLLPAPTSLKPRAI
jgi:hypothetical protein